MIDHLATQLQTLIHELSERERLIIALYYYEKLTPVEIGQILNITEACATESINKVLNQLRTQMKGEQTP